MADEIARMEALNRWVQEVTSTRSLAWTYGTVLLNDDFPERWDSNFLRVDRPVGAATAAEVHDEADRLLAHLGHREVVIDDPNDGARLAPGFEALGYERDELVYMVLRREADHPPSVAAREVSREIARPVVVTSNRESHGSADAASAERLADFDEVLAERAGARFFVAEIDGELASTCQLFVHEGAAQVESVDTLSAFRNRGGARAVVTTAVETGRAAGADLIWLQADANGWPRHLYAKLGFDEVGSAWAFTKPPPGVTR